MGVGDIKKMLEGQEEDDLEWALFYDFEFFNRGPYLIK